MYDKEYASFPDLNSDQEQLEVRALSKYNGGKQNWPFWFEGF